MLCHDFWLHHPMDSSKMNTDCSPLPILKLSRHCTQATWSCVSYDASVAVPFEIRKDVGLSHGLVQLLKQLFLRLSPNKRLILFKLLRRSSASCAKSGRILTEYCTRWTKDLTWEVSWGELTFRMAAAFSSQGRYLGCFDHDRKRSIWQDETGICLHSALALSSSIE